MITEEDLQYFVTQYSNTGFRGGLNWYRNIYTNWKWHLQTADRIINQPGLMVTAAKDSVLVPEMSHGMEKIVPNLTRHNVTQAGHWVQQEEPEEVNRVLVDWLVGLGIPKEAKL